MYSLLPSFVAVLFLAYGLYIFAENGLTRISTNFIVLCLTTFCWQITWAVLFQVHDPETALYLIKFGYLLILFLPTSLYGFLIEISEKPSERRYVYASYGFAALLGIVLFSSDSLIDGYYQYAFGYYPKAGTLHPIHILQTCLVVSRGLYVAYQRRNSLSPNTPKRAILNLRIAGVIVYFFAAIDYLCNYGIEFYPPGFLFVGISLGMLAVAIIRYNIMDPMAVAGSIAHEIRNTLGTILMQAEFSGVYWDDLYQGYQLAVKHGLYPANISPDVLECLSEVAGDISQDVAKSNLLIGTMLASVSMDQLDKSEFKNHSISACVTDVLRRYPFSKQERADTTISKQEDFDFYGSDTLLTFALFNLIKNALYAISKAGHGSITLSFERGATYNRLHVTDTSTGIAPEAIPRIFDMFFTTKKSAGNGFGLAFCQRVMKSFDGRISCDSVLGEYTTFTLEFPVIVPPVS